MKKKLDKKISLNKMTISNLSMDAQKAIYGAINGCRPTISGSCLQDTCGCPTEVGPTCAGGSDIACWACR